MTDSHGPWDAENRESAHIKSLKQRYLEERDKRVNARRGEVVSLSGDLEHYLDDPHTPALPREAVDSDVDVVVVGAGFGGLLAGAKLRDRGIEKIRLIDKAGDVGGTWYWNRYPGARCDIESYIYMPLLEETGYVPTEKYATGSEILEHAGRIARQYDLYRDALFHTAVTSAVWDESRQRWHITTDRGDDFEARFLVHCIGFLSNPKLTAVPGIGTFTGRAFHSSRWDYAYTGGGPDGDLVNLRDKVVGVIGTGATAVQIIPNVARYAKHLYVFQRTPAAVGVRGNRPTEPGWAESFAAGWQKARMENFTAFTMGDFTPEENLVADGWIDVFHGVLHGPRQRAVAAQMSAEETAALLEAEDAKRMDAIRARVVRTVSNPDVADALKPYYFILCKRPLFHDEYLDVYNRDNVTLVSAPGGVEGIWESGVVCNGERHQLDCLIYSTGFETSWESGPSMSRRAGYETVGRDGRTLTEHWANGTRTFQGWGCSEFPNMVIMPSGVATSVRTPNHMHTLTENAVHASYIIAEVMSREAGTFEPTREAETEWTEWVVGQSTDARAFLARCTPGRFNNEGDLDQRPADVAFVEKPVLFFRDLAAWRENNELAGLILEDGASVDDAKSPTRGVVRLMRSGVPRARAWASVDQRSHSHRTER